MKPRVAGALAMCVAALQSGAASGASCAVYNSPALTFGTYNPVSGSPTFANTSIVVQCSAVLQLLNTTVPFTLLLSAGTSGSVTNRTMSGGSTNLPYNVYTSASYTTVWDNTTGVSGSVTLPNLLGIGALATGYATVVGYGRILASQPVAVGSYTDNLVITVSF